MCKKPFTPDNCPIQVGMFIWNPETNSDLVVLERFLDGTSPDDPIIRTCSRTFSGNQLMDSNIEYYLGDVTTEQKRAFIEEDTSPYKEISRVTLVTSELTISAEACMNTDINQRELFVVNNTSGIGGKVAILQYPGCSFFNYGSVVLINESDNSILCVYDDVQWVHHMFGDIGYDSVNSSKEAEEYVKNVLYKIAQYLK